MNEMMQHQAVADVARSLIEQIAPQELPLFRATSAAYFKNPRRALGGQSGRDEMLGFGSGEEVSFLTPIILVAATKVVEFAAGGPVQEAPRKGLAGLMGGLMRKKQPQNDQQPVSVLTPEKAVQARGLALETLRQHNFPEDKREAVADTLIAKLPVARAE